MEWFSEQALAAVLAIVSTVLGGLIVNRLQPRVQLRWSATHEFTYNIVSGAAQFLLLSKTIVVQNFGRLVANNLEIVLGMRPEHFQVWPPTNFDRDTTPDNFHIIRIPKVRPGEYFHLEFLHTNELPVLITIRSDEGPAKEITTMPGRIWPKWVQLLSLVTSWIGIAFILYWLFIASFAFLGNLGTISVQS